MTLKSEPFGSYEKIGETLLGFHVVLETDDEYPGDVYPWFEYEICDRTNGFTNTRIRFPLFMGDFESANSKMLMQMSDAFSKAKIRLNEIIKEREVN